MKYKGQKKNKKKERNQKRVIEDSRRKLCAPHKKKKYVIALETKLHPLNRNRSYTCKKNTLIRKIPLKMNTQNNTTTKIRRNSGRQSLKKSGKQNNKEKKVSNN